MAVQLLFTSALGHLGGRWGFYAVNPDGTDQMLLGRNLPGNGDSGNLRIKIVGDKIYTATVERASNIPIAVTFRRYDADFTNEEILFEHDFPDRSRFNFPGFEDFAVGGNKIYWSEIYTRGFTSTWSIRSANLDGTNSSNIYSLVGAQIRSLEVVGSNLYFVRHITIRGGEFGQELQRIDLVRLQPPTRVIRIAPSGRQSVFNNLLFTDTHIYVNVEIARLDADGIPTGDIGYIYRYNLNGSGRVTLGTRVANAGEHHISGIAVDSTHIYIEADDAIRRAPLTTRNSDYTTWAVIWDDHHSGFIIGFANVPIFRNIYNVRLDVPVAKNIYNPSLDVPIFRNIYRVRLDVRAPTVIYEVFLDIPNDPIIGPPMPAPPDKGDPPNEDDMTTPGLWVDLNLDGDPMTARLTNVWEDVLRFSFGWGRNEEAHGAIAMPLAGQVILDNTSGRYDPERILPAARCWFDQALDDTNFEGVARGFVRQVLPSEDHGTGVKSAVLHIEGVLARLATADFELPLLVSETIRTGALINLCLDGAGWFANRRSIAKGQVRLNPAHYVNILLPRQVTQAIGILRGAELAEVDGLLHEDRGYDVVFEDRWQRELDDRDPVITFGTDETTIQPHGVIAPSDSWTNIVTVVRAGAERAIVLTEGKVYTFRKGNIDDNPLTLTPNASSTFTCDIRTEEHNRERQEVHQVVSWSPIAPEHYSFSNGGAGMGIQVISQTRYKRVIRITNGNNFTVNLTKLELYGRGIALYGDLTIPDVESPNIRFYNRRYLDLPRSFIGDGSNHGGDPVEEGRDFAHSLLAKFDHPIAASRLRFYPTPAQLVGLKTSDPVQVNAGLGIPAGIYLVEGGEVHYDAEAVPDVEMVLKVSRRGRKTFIRNVPKNDVAPANWAQIDPSLALDPNRFYVFAAEVSGDLSGDDPVLRLYEGDKIIKEWYPIDIDGTPGYLAGIIMPSVAVNGRMEARGGVNVSRYKVARIES